MDDLITLREAADQLKVTYEEVWQLTRRHEIEGYRVSGQWLVSRRQISEYALARLRQARQSPS